MKQISNNFREALRGIRELNAFITYQSTTGENYILSTENDKNMATELGSLLALEQNYTIIEPESLNSVKPSFNVELFKTICKSIQIDTKIEIPKKTWLNCQIGALVNNSYEYLNFGDYLITEIEYKADTESYLITAYDKMVESMIPYDLTLTYPLTIKNLLIAICNRLNWEYDLSTFINQDKVLTADLFINQDITFRDVLDDISQITGGNIGFDGKYLKIKYINALENSTRLPFTIPQTINVGESIDNRKITEEDLKDTNVTINKKYGKVNSIVITNNDVVLNNLKDITIDGDTEYVFKDNRILSYDSDTYITDLFNSIKGLEFYLYDFDTIGKLCFDPLDEVIISIYNEEYPTIILNSEITLTTGLTETMYLEEPEDTTQEYIVNNKNEKKINNALISIDKANAEIVLKVDSQGRIASVSLNGNADEGTLVEFKADQIKLEGYTTINGNFKVDLSGNVEATGGTIAGWTIDGDKFSKGQYFLNKNGYARIYTYADLVIIRNYLLGRIELDATDIAYYDMNGDGVVNSAELLILRQKILGW